jgi:hypothetical protein
MAIRESRTASGARVVEPSGSNCTTAGAIKNPAQGRIVYWRPEKDEAGHHWVEILALP